MKLETVLHHYAICALWSSTQDDGEPLDAVYTSDDIAPETLESMRSDCADFIESNAEALEESGLSDEQIGHDFWLTRNGHGAGFWDRGLGEIGEALTKASKHYGEVYLYVGDDGYIYG
jgi:hypothetical protein